MIQNSHDDVDNITRAYILIMIGQGAPKELIEKLTGFEKMII